MLAQMMMTSCGCDLSDSKRASRSQVPAPMRRHRGESQPGRSMGLLIVGVLNTLCKRDAPEHNISTCKYTWIQLPGGRRAVPFSS